MIKTKMEIISRKQLAKDTVELVLKNKYVSMQATPGQFLHIQVPGHTLRRPLSIASVDWEAHTTTILFKIVGSGTDLLATYQNGAKIDVLGPNGNGFPLEEAANLSTVLILGGGIGIPPLYFLATKLHALGIQVKAILGFQHKEYVFYEEKFKRIADTVIVTNDGSYGREGFVTDLVQDVGDFERYYSCGPLPMLKAVNEVLSDREGYLSFEERMGCGVGACYACVIPTKDEAGYKKICHQGPVFASNEVIL